MALRDPVVYFHVIALREFFPLRPTVSELEPLAVDEAKKLLSRIAASEHAYLRKLNDAGLINFSDIEDVIRQIVKDRFGLARDLLALAKSTSADSEVAKRRAVSTCYYSVYHGCRAVVLFHDKVDRGDEHERLPRNMEAILPGRGVQPQLEKMMSRRRCADYDPYLEFDLDSALAEMITEADQLLAALATYLSTAGVDL